MSKTKKMIYLALLSSMATTLHILESLIPIPLPYGVKLGFANIISLVTVEIFSIKDMIIVNIIRVILTSLIRGTFFSSTFLISSGGVLLSTLSIIYIKRFTNESIIFTSILSAISHNIGQVLVIMFIYSNSYLSTILPILLVTAIPTGIVTGVAARETSKKLSYI